MVRRIALLPFLAILLAVLGCDTLFQDEPAKQKKSEKKKAAEKKDGETKAAETASTAKPATHKVEKGPFKIDVSAKGMFESRKMTEVALHPEAWSPNTGGMLLVRKAVEQGTRVKAGDQLVWFDMERLNNTISDLENEQRLSTLAIKLAEEELPILEKTTPLDLQAAERSQKQTEEDLKRYFDKERALAEESANRMVKSAKEYLEYEQEELKQLEKMYKANDLTEETEEIILKRQRNSVEDMKWYLQMAEHRREQVLKTQMPRQDIRIKEQAVREELALQKARASLPIALNQKKLGLAKLKYDSNKSGERLAKLKRDRELLTVKAPADGIVYYGKCQHGQWQTASMMQSKLQRGGMLMADEVIMTIVEPRPLFVRATIEEKDLQHIRQGATAKVVPTINPDRRIPAKILDVTATPVSAGNFEAKVSIELSDEDDPLVPGMACSVKLVPYRKAEALTVPSSAVFTEDLDEDEHYVYLQPKEGKAKKTTVKIGKKSGTKTEILDGLKAGDEILLEKPKSEDKGKEGA